ncbi:MAG TPA: PilZ domain-containing protein, partial [Spirochaetota bacterium]|nr:PilZ domain-containing protein [Spirochaetota bacterium]
IREYDMDDREKQRVIFHVSASLDFAGQTINGNVENLSIGGMLVNTAERVPDDNKAEATVYLSGSSSELCLNMTCEVIRKGAHCLAVKFTKIDIDSYIHLKNIIAFNKMDEYQIIKEFESSLPGIEV